MKKYTVNIYRKNETAMDGEKILERSYKTNSYRDMLKKLARQNDFFYYEHDVEIIDNKTREEINIFY
jgi:gluconate kinase